MHEIRWEKDIRCEDWIWYDNTTTWKWYEIMQNHTIMHKMQQTETRALRAPFEFEAAPSLCWCSTSASSTCLKVFQEGDRICMGQGGLSKIVQWDSGHWVWGSIPDRKGGTVASLNLFMEAKSKKTVTYFFICFPLQGREHMRQCFGGK